MVRIAAILVAFALAHFADGLIGLPILQAAFVLAFWIYLARQIWLSRRDGLKDWRYSLAMAVVLLVLTGFAAMSMLPLYDAVAVKIGWSPDPNGLLAN